MATNGSRESRWALIRQSVYSFNLFSKFSFSHPKNKLSTQPDICQEWYIKTSLHFTSCIPSVFSAELLQYSRQCPSFSTHSATLMTKTYLTFQSFFSKICEFRSSTLLSLQVFISREAFRVKFGRGVIFLVQSQFFATHISNQWDCFILCRLKLTSNSFFVFANVVKGMLSSNF